MCLVSCGNRWLESTQRGKPGNTYGKKARLTAHFLHVEHVHLERRENHRAELVFKPEVGERDQSRLECMDHIPEHTAERDERELAESGERAVVAGVADKRGDIFHI